MPLLNVSCTPRHTRLRTTSSSPSTEVPDGFPCHGVQHAEPSRREETHWNADTQEGAVVFDPNVQKHHHLIDDDTGDIYDIPWDQLEVKERRSSRILKFLSFK